MDEYFLFATINVILATLKGWNCNAATMRVCDLLRKLVVPLFIEEKFTVEVKCWGMGDRLDLIWSPMSGRSMMDLMGWFTSDFTYRNVWSSDQHMSWQLHVWTACLTHLKWRMMVSECVLFVCLFVFRRSVFLRHWRIFSVMIDPHADINRILDKVPDSNSISNVQVKQHVHQLLL